MKSEAVFTDMHKFNVDSYDSANYSSGLVGRVMSRGHKLLDAMDDHSPSSGTIEDGAGSGAHLAQAKRQFRTYTLTDSNEAMLDMALTTHASRNGVSFRLGGAAASSVPGSHHGRLVATHFLENMPNPHLVTRVWDHVVRPGGTIALVQLYDSGLARRFGRCFGPRRAGEKNRLPYDYFTVDEQVNAVFKLATLIDYCLDEHESILWPRRFPSDDVEVFYVTTIRKSK